MESPNMNNPGVPEQFQPYFWDADISKLEITKNGLYIITRLLNYGDQNTLKWVFQTYDEQKIKNTVENSRGLTRKAGRFWQYYFGLEESRLKCFQIHEAMKGMYSF